PEPRCLRARDALASIVAFGGFSSSDRREVSKLSRYFDIIAHLRKELVEWQDRGRADTKVLAAALRRATAETEALVGDDPVVREHLLPILLMPFDVNGVPTGPTDR